MDSKDEKGVFVPDAALSGGIGATARGPLAALVQRQMAEQEALHGYSPPGKRSRPQVEWVKNPMDGSILKDHKGYPVSVPRLLATKPLRAELCSRPGPGGKRLTYLSGEGVTRTLNDIFGFDGWNLEIVKTTQVVCEKDKKERWCVAYTAQVRLTHTKSGTYKEDVGFSDSMDRNMGSAVGNALKGSITDALKRAAKHFGDKLGNAIYNGTCTAKNAPVTLRDALDLYDKERAATKFGTARINPQEAVIKLEGDNANVATINNNNSSLAARPMPSPQPAAATTTTNTIAKPIQQPGPLPSNSARVPTVTQYNNANGAVKSQLAATSVQARNSHGMPARVSDVGVSITPATARMPSGGMKPPSAPNGIAPPLSASDRLNQSSMFGSQAPVAISTNKENAYHNGQQVHANIMTVGRPVTSSGRRNYMSEPPAVEWSRNQASSTGMKRPLDHNDTAAGTMASNKKINTNPYQKG